MKPIAIIPARGGSKRVPNKNTRDFFGKPMIAWTIERALQSDLFSQVFVTTDAAHISEIAISSGAEIIHRGLELSDDFTGTVPVIADALSKIGINNSTKPVTVLCIYPVTPLVQYSRIGRAINLLSEVPCDYVLPVMPSPQPIDRGFYLEKDRTLTNVNFSAAEQRTQDSGQSYFDAGQFYVANSDTWLQHRPVLSPRSVAIVLNKHEVIDVDDESDWQLVQQLYSIRHAL